MTNSQEKFSHKEAIEKLKDDDVEVRKLAVNSLEGTTDEVAIGPLIEAMKDENTPVRHKAAEILGNMGDVVVDELINIVNSEEGEYKRFASFALKLTGSEKAIDYFASAINDEDFGVRKVAVRSLGELKATDKIDDIAKVMMEEEDWGVRLAAIRALGDMEVEEAIVVIKKARRKEKDKDFKKAANKAIKKIEKAIK
ncbi:MAG: HEAT repeat domain-containing protein [Methanobrevibacter sp.]|nr:HEAT repeat domain-containing protein [Methanobrevibacter sp.]